MEFVGIDANLETSLFEYGFICTPRTKDYPDEHFIVYRAGMFVDGKLSFDTGYIRESELDSLIKAEEWADVDDVQRFLSSVGLRESEWLTLPFVQKFGGCFQYWGPENIMGTAYYPMTEKQVRSRYFER